MADSGGASAGSKLDELRVRCGIWVVGMGLATVLLALGVAVWRFTTAADVTAVVGSTTGVVGTLIGAFFGLQIGSAGKEKVQEERKDAEDKALAFASALAPADADRILASLR